MRVWPFGINQDNLNIYERDGNSYMVYHDPGVPPLIDDNAETNQQFIDAF